LAVLFEQRVVGDGQTEAGRFGDACPLCKAEGHTPGGRGGGSGEQDNSVEIITKDTKDCASVGKASEALSGNTSPSLILPQKRKAEDVSASDSKTMKFLYTSGDASTSSTSQNIETHSARSTAEGGGDDAERVHSSADGEHDACSGGGAVDRKDWSKWRADGKGSNSGIEVTKSNNPGTEVTKGSNPGTEASLSEEEVEGRVRECLQCVQVMWCVSSQQLIATLYRLVVFK
jgi:hypothetical protein